MGILSYIKDNIWKTLFGKPADSLERSTDKQDECISAFSVETLRTITEKHTRLRMRLLDTASPDEQGATESRSALKPQS